MPLQRRQARNRVWQKHVDSVLLDGRDLRIRVVVELNDETHERAGRREGDALVDRALGQAGVPVVRVAAAAGYGVGAVWRLIREALMELKRLLLPQNDSTAVEFRAWDEVLPQFSAKHFGERAHNRKGSRRRL
ncbi:MAG TPA: DUF2726 domain-containing protein [Phycisphaerae bacterium]|nr:DUF2726 domain-containing protein [Phycisphaerae bacterium]